MAEIVPNIKTGKIRTKWSFLGLFKLEKNKTQIVFVSYLMKRSKNVKWAGEIQGVREWRFYRENIWLLSIFARDPTVDGRRDNMKAALRGEGFAWVPDLRSFDKLREVGDISYLGFTLYLSVL